MGRYELNLRRREATPCCPLCRDALGAGEGETCRGCGVDYHPACLREFSGCATLGCERAGEPPTAGGDVTLADLAIPAHVAERLGLLPQRHGVTCACGQRVEFFPLNLYVAPVCRSCGGVIDLLPTVLDHVVAQGVHRAAATSVVGACAALVLWVWVGPGVAVAAGAFAVVLSAVIALRARRARRALALAGRLSPRATR